VSSGVRLSWVTGSNDHVISILTAPEPGSDGHDRNALDEKIILLVDYDYTRNPFGTQYVVSFLYTSFIQLLFLPSLSMLEPPKTMPGV
jgi:hypothetical protein